MHVGQELATRAKMWEEGRFYELLTRLETHIMKENEPTKKQLAGEKQDAVRRRRAFKQTKEGAYWKAFNGMTGKAADISGTTLRSFSRPRTGSRPWHPPPRI